MVTRQFMFWLYCGLLHRGLCRVGRADLCNSNLFFARWMCKNLVTLYWIVDRQLCHAIWLSLVGSAFFCLSYVTVCCVVDRPGCWLSLQSCICWLLRSSTCYSVVLLTLFQHLWNNAFARYAPSVIWCCWATSGPLRTLAPGWPQTWNTQGFHWTWKTRGILCSNYYY